jgi:GR25 family glycosyltransferase involved in LPS biosynthesis
MNNFDIIYYINLEHRNDRFNHINNEFLKVNIDKKKINRIDGVYIKEFGALGCAKSHIKTLETFLKTSNDIQNCIIFEDDFEFTQSKEIVDDLLNNFYNNIKNYDILMLSSNVLDWRDTDYKFIIKILDAQTLSGYCITKKYAVKLLNNFKIAEQLLTQVGRQVHPFCIDIFMKQLQKIDNWYCINPKIGKQMESYSDIEKRVVDYEC